MKNSEKTMEKIVSLCKGRGFIFSGSEIYGGLANTWDYGPLGVELKNNVKKAWWKKFVQENPYNVGLDAAILMNPQTWVASGHLSGFSDPLMDCRECHERFRADKLIEAWCAENAPGIEIVKVNDAGDTTAATDNMSAALQANDDLVGLFCVDGIAGTAGPTAVAESGKDLRVLAFDVDTTVLDKVKNGEIDATVAQGMYNMGFWSMMFLYTEANGLSAKALPQNVDTGVTIVTKENVDEYYPK